MAAFLALQEHCETDDATNSLEHAQARIAAVKRALAEAPFDSALDGALRKNLRMLYNLHRALSFKAHIDALNDQDFLLREGPAVAKPGKLLNERKQALLQRNRHFLTVASEMSRDCDRPEAWGKFAEQLLGFSRSVKSWAPSAEDTTQLLKQGPYHVAKQLHHLGKLTHPFRRQVRERRQLDFSIDGVRIAQHVWPSIKLTPTEQELWCRLQRMILCMRLRQHGSYDQVLPGRKRRRLADSERGFREGLPNEICNKICRLL